ncbi:hypothetical protein QE152_g40034 [Popillia japonica]|uniref:Uncharacterized protein n=1 Tax=Popillia japonica TaxID=7064 RepID=A0AAW1HSR5_POPJA
MRSCVNLMEASSGFIEWKKSSHLFSNVQSPFSDGSFTVVNRHLGPAGKKKTSIIDLQKMQQDELERLIDEIPTDDESVTSDINNVMEDEADLDAPITLNNTNLFDIENMAIIFDEPNQGIGAGNLRLLTEDVIELMSEQSSEFRAAGIEPFNDQIFSNDEFLSSYVTDRPEKISQEEAGPSHIEISQAEAEESQAKSSYTEVLQVEQLQTEPPLHSGVIKETVSQIITPEQIRPHPKAEPRKSTIRRKKGKSLILTDTPVKENLEEAQIITPEQIRPHPKAEPRKSTIRRRTGKSLILTDTPVKENLEEGKNCVFLATDWWSKTRFKF